MIALADVSGRLADWFAEKLGVPEVSVSEFRRHAEGWSWQTYTMCIEWTDQDGRARSEGFAVRREPDDGLLAPYDTNQQFRIHQAVVQHSDVPMPALNWLELDQAILGRPFYVMERMQGVVPVQWRGEDPSVFPDPETRRGIGVDFVDVLSRIHSIDVGSGDFDFFESPRDAEHAARQQIDHWEEVYDAAALIEVPLIRECLRWLRRNVATSGRLALVHGDYRIGNFMLGDDRRINAVFDWELAHLGDPVFDVAWAGMRLFRGRSELFSHLLPRHDMLTEYAGRTGCAVDDEVFAFWTIFGHLRASVPHISAARAFEDGRASDLRLAAMGHQNLYILKQLVAELGVTRRSGPTVARENGERPADIAAEAAGLGAMQNSLTRLFEGIAEQLATTIAPAVEDPFVKSQVMAAIELLNNLATRVEWNAVGCVEFIGLVREAVEAATDPPSHVRELVAEPLPEPGDTAGLLAAERRHRRALAEMQVWLDQGEGRPDLEAVVQDLALWDLERELSRLRSGMYSASRKQRK